MLNDLAFLLSPNLLYQKIPLGNESDQFLHPHKLYNKFTAKALTPEPSLRTHCTAEYLCFCADRENGCPSWSEPSLVARVIFISLNLNTYANGEIWHTELDSNDYDLSENKINGRLIFQILEFFDIGHIVSFFLVELL